MQNGFEYTSAPRSVAVNRTKYRDPQYNEDMKRQQNLMYDRRVIRGNTHVRPAGNTLQTNLMQEDPFSQKTDKTDKTVNKTKKIKKSNSNSSNNNHNIHNDRMVQSILPVEGRKHMDIQTDTYLEELTDKIPEKNIETQTDTYIDLPPPPIFIPQKSGEDASTQIENGDLFDFDMEVEPILEVLVGKTLEVSLLEVMEEEELNEIRKQQEIFEQNRNAELAEIQRLESESKRKHNEKQKRIDEEKKKKEQEQELQEKVAARSYTKQYLTNLHTTVFSNLLENGHFYDPLLREVQEQFMPFLFTNVMRNADEIHFSRQLTDNLIQDVLMKVQKENALKKQKLKENINETES